MSAAESSSGAAGAGRGLTPRASSGAVPASGTATPAFPSPRPFVRRLDAYTPGEQPTGGGVIKLNTNEFPYPPAPEVVEAVRRAGGDAMRLYPSPRCDELREAIGRRFGLSPEAVFVGNGSDEVLRLVIQAYGGKGRLTASVSPTYSLYPTLVQLAEGDYQEFPLDDLERMTDEPVKVAWDLFLLCQPNPPLGTMWGDDKINSLSAKEGMLLLDQAYAEFADDDVQRSIAAVETGNVAISRTFSKAYGLAGLRIGYLLGDRAIIANISKLADSYNVNRLSQAAAVAALGAQGYYDDRIGEIRRNRTWLLEVLTGRGFIVPESQGNFLYARHEQAQRLYRDLKTRNILVRFFGKPPLEDGLRITIGTRDELEQLIDALDELL